MPHDRRKIRELMSASEFALVDASSPAGIRRLSPRTLQLNVSRARRLRDKQRDLHRRQRLKRRARTGTKHGGTERTARKAELFDQALMRFTRRLQTMKAKPQSRTRKSGPAALRQKARTPRTKAMQAHVGSRGRRSQARRDSR